MKKIVLLLVLISNIAFGANSMRNCMLLPITDPGKGEIGFGVFEQLEDYLKESEWCNYRPNSEILNILGQYKRNISAHLKNKEVLRLVADKTASGTMIHVEITNRVKGYEVSVTVIGDNGEDVYYSQKETLAYLDVSNISSTVEKWLMDFEKTIPYDGRIIGILGNQFTVDFGKDYGVKIGDTIKIKRPVRKKTHPLLKEIVDWEFKTIARGRVYSITSDQAQCRVEEYNSRSKIKVEDWVELIANDKEYEPDKVDGEKFKFGKLGTIGIFGNLTKATESLADAKHSGYLLGVNSRLELWATRTWWGSLELQKDFGTLSRDKGEMPSSTTLDTTHYKLTGGYKYLPLGYFFGPQIDLYGGYASYNYSLSTDNASHVTGVTFYGLIFGVKVDIPIFNKYRGFASLDIMPFAGYEEEVNLNGSDKSTMGYNFEIGGTYTLNPRTSLYGSIDYLSNKAKFKSNSSGVGSVTMTDTALKFGGLFTF